MAQPHSDVYVFAWTRRNRGELRVFSRRHGSQTERGLDAEWMEALLGQFVLTSSPRIEVRLCHSPFLFCFVFLLCVVNFKK